VRLEYESVSVSESMSDVLAERYASRAMREIWAPEAKVIRERELWSCAHK
jgi:hypothetical protein